MKAESDEVREIGCGLLLVACAAELALILFAAKCSMVRTVHEEAMRCLASGEPGRAVLILEARTNIRFDATGKLENELAPLRCAPKVEVGP